MKSWTTRLGSLGVCLQLACSSTAPGVARSTATAPPAEVRVEKREEVAQPPRAAGARRVEFPPLGIELSPEPPWWRAPASDEARPGDVSFSLLGAPLSDAPGAVPHAICAGAPALIVDTALHGKQAWVRVIGADGAFGWTEWLEDATSRPAALYSAKGSYDLAAEAPGQGSPEVDYMRAEGRLAKVVGATREPTVARIDQLGLALDHNVALAPWLDAELDANVRGLVPGFEYELAWQSEAGHGHALPLRGLVQRWFWASAGTEPACSSELSRIETRVGRVTLRVCEAEERRAWLHVERPGQQPYEVPTSADAVWIARYSERNLDDDRALDWAIEVVARDSHGAASELVLLPARKRAALRLALDSPAESWWIGAGPALWLSHTEAGRLHARAYRVVNDQLEGTAGWVVQLPRPLARLEAQRMTLGSRAARTYAAAPERYWVWQGALVKPKSTVAFPLLTPDVLETPADSAPPLLENPSD